MKLDRLWLGLLIAAVPVVAEPLVEPLDEALLLRLFPRPPAVVVAAQAVDLAGHGPLAIAVLYGVDLPGRYRLGVITLDDAGEPRLRPEHLKVPRPDRQAELGLRDLTGDGLPELIVTGGLSPRGSAYQVYGWRHGQLVTLLTLTDAAPTAPFEVDLDVDGRVDVVHPTGRHGLGPVPDLSLWRLDAYTFDGERFVPLHQRWRTADVEGLAEARRAAAGHRWAEAMQAAEQAVAQAPGPLTWGYRNQLRHRIALYRGQVRPLPDDPAAITPAVVLADVVGLALAGEFEQAGLGLLRLAGPDQLPERWPEAVLPLVPMLRSARAVRPDFAARPGEELLWALARAAQQDLASARVAAQRADQARRQQGLTPLPEPWRAWALPEPEPAAPPRGTAAP